MSDNGTVYYERIDKSKLFSKSPKVFEGFKESSEVFDDSKESSEVFDDSTDI